MVDSWLAHSFGLLSLLVAAADAVLDAEQLHVSVTGQGRLTVSWASPAGQLAELVVERVNGAEARPGPRQAVKPNTSSYAWQCGPRYRARCRVQTVYHSPLLLHAEIAVEPAAEYRYSIELGNESSGWRQIRAPPAAGARELRLAFLGDLGCTRFSASTCEDLARAHQEEALDAAVLLGDMAYADTNPSRWDDFGRLFDEAGCSRVPWLVLPGNHELEPDEVSGQPFVPYRKRWRTPEAKEEQVGNDTQVVNWGTCDLRSKYDFGGSFWALAMGSAHFISLNPYTHASTDSQQIIWLRDELKRVNRSLTPHVIVLTHAPWEHSSRVHRAELELATSTLRKSAAELLQRAEADMLFAGHVHAYQRSEPVKGVRHFIVGHGGNSEGLYTDWMDWQHNAFHSSDHYGWGILELQGRSVKWQTRRSHDGATIDTAEWVRNSGEDAGDGASERHQLHAASQRGDRGSSMMGVAVGVLGASAVAVAFACLYCRRLQKQLAEAEERSGFKTSAAVIGAREGSR